MVTDLDVIEEEKFVSIRSRGEQIFFATRVMWKFLPDYVRARILRLAEEYEKIRYK